MPGSVAGLCLALERWGTMELRDVLQPGDRHRRARLRGGLVSGADHGQASSRSCPCIPESARTYLRDGRFIYRPPSMQPGDRVVFPDLARSLALIARDGPDAFYRGAIAQAIHDDMAAHGGLITREDLAAYRGADRRAAAGTLPRPRPRVVAGLDRRDHRAGDPQHPRRVSQGRGRLAHRRGPAPARRGCRPRLSRPVAASRRPRARSRRLGAARLAGVRARDRGGAAWWRLGGRGRRGGSFAQEPHSLCEPPRASGPEPVARAWPQSPAAPARRPVADDCTTHVSVDRPAAEHGRADAHGRLDLRLAMWSCPARASC